MIANLLLHARFNDLIISLFVRASQIRLHWQKQKRRWGYLRIEKNISSTRVSNRLKISQMSATVCNHRCYLSSSISHHQVERTSYQRTRRLVVHKVKVIEGQEAIWVYCTRIRFPLSLFFSQLNNNNNM